MKLLLSDAPVLPRRGGPPLRHALLDGAELERQSRSPTLMTVRLDGCEHEWSTFPRLRRLGQGAVELRSVVVAQRGLVLGATAKVFHVCILRSLSVRHNPRVVGLVGP